LEPEEDLWVAMVGLLVAVPEVVLPLEEVRRLVGVEATGFFITAVRGGLTFVSCCCRA
jgi:hypothetical protein